MKISTETLNIWKSFSAINQSLIVNPGNKIRTISQHGSLMADAIVDETFEVPFAIYNMAQFIALCTMNDSPDFQFDTNQVIIQSGAYEVSYTYSASQLIKQPPTDEIEMNGNLIEFSITSENITTLMHAASILQLPDFAFTCVDGVISACAINHEDTTSNIYKHERLAYFENQPDFIAIIRIENMLMMLQDYNVSISSDGIVRFANDKLTYWIALEQSSTFTGE